MDPTPTTSITSPQLLAQGPPTPPPPSLPEVLRAFRQRFVVAATYFAIVWTLGAVGYRLLEGWPWLDSLYMAAITATSVGFMEVHPLSDAGRTFTMLVVIFGIVGLGIWWALMTALIVEADLGGLLRRWKKMRKIDDLVDHFIVCGAGRMGSVVVEEMIRAGRSFAVVESEPSRVARIEELYPDVLIAQGDATKEQTLRDLNVGQACGLACCLPGDADNLLLCLTARGLKPSLHIVARAYDQESLEKLRRAGASQAISPTYTGAVRIATALLRPTVVSFLDAATVGGEVTLRLEQTTIPATSALVGKTLVDARIPQKTGLIVLGVRSAGSKASPRYNPGPETRLAAGDEMIVLGRQEQIEQLRAYVDS